MGDELIRDNTVFHGVVFDFDRDVTIIDGKTPEGHGSGEEFGNTIQLEDGTLATPYSHRHAESAGAVGTEGAYMEVAR